MLNAASSVQIVSLASRYWRSHLDRNSHSVKLISNFNLVSRLRLLELVPSLQCKSL